MATILESTVHICVQTKNNQNLNVTTDFKISDLAEIQFISYNLRRSGETFNIKVPIFYVL